MPFSGFLVYQGHFNLFLVAFFGAGGCLLGATAAYLIGYYGGRPLIEKYGKYILISHHDLDRAENWFEKYGNVTVFFSRFVPIVRTYISFPAGVSQMPIWKFWIYTVVGDFLWSLGLAYIGFRAGERWEFLKNYFHKI